MKGASLLCAVRGFEKEKTSCEADGDGTIGCVNEVDLEVNSRISLIVWAQQYGENSVFHAHLQVLDSP